MPWRVFAVNTLVADGRVTVKLRQGNIHCTRGVYVESGEQVDTIAALVRQKSERMTKEFIDATFFEGRRATHGNEC